MPGNASVAVIIPTKDRPKLLDEAIASAQQQTHAPTEVIVVDDGSTIQVDEPRCGRIYMCFRLRSALE